MNKSALEGSLEELYRAVMNAGPGDIIKLPKGWSIKDYQDFIRGYVDMWDPLLKQREFCKAMDVPVATKPTTPEYKLQGLCRSLIVEEFNELETEYLKLQALHERVAKGTLPAQEAEALSHVYMQNMCAEMCDLIYVICQQANVYGLPLTEMYTAIHKANMDKVGADGKVVRREDGKVLKPDGWKPADLQAIYLKSRNGAC